MTIIISAQASVWTFQPSWKPVCSVPMTIRLRPRYTCALVHALSDQPPGVIARLRMPRHVSQTISSAPMVPSV